MIYNILFSYGSRINLGPCVVTAQDDTTMSSFFNTTDSRYIDFTTLDITVGERLYVSQDGYSILFGRISSISASSITISQNPGQVIHNIVLKDGFIKPFIKRTPYLYSYPCASYCGISLTKKGNSYRTYAEANPLFSAATSVEEDSIISMYFKKGSNIDEVQINVKNGAEAKCIKAINKVLRLQKDIDFTTEIQKITTDIIGVNAIAAANKTNLY